MTVFGAVVSAHEVENHVLTTLETWIHDYLGDVERHYQLEVGRALLRPRSYRKTAGDVATLTDAQLPRLVVQSAGWAEEPYDDGEALTARLAISVAVLIKGAVDDEALDRARMYAAAVTKLLLHKLAGELVVDVRVLDHNYDPVPQQFQRTLAGCEVVISVLVPEVASTFGGPALPSPQPPLDDPTVPSDPGDWPAVEEVIVTAHPETEIL